MQPNYPPPPGAYPPPPGQYAPVPQQAPSYVVPNVVEPGGGSGGDWAPLPRHLIGYAAIMLPTMFDPNNQGPGGAVKPQVTVDFVVVNVGPDGRLLGPIQFGDSQARDGTHHPAWFQLDAFPAEFRGARWTNNEIVKDLAPLVGTGNITMGRFRLGDKGNRPPLLERMDPNDPARAVLLEAWQQRTMNPGSLRRSVEQGGIVHINGGPVEKQQQGAPQGMPPQPGAAYTGYAAGAPQQGYQQPAQQWGGPVAPPMPPQPGQQVQYPPPPPPPAPAPTGPAPMPAAAAAAGWTPEQWAAAPPHIRQAYGA